ncbi:MAG: PAS domain S-box protein [Gammaproteobacteria bacterium]
MPTGSASTAAPAQSSPAPDPVFSGLARLAAGTCAASFASVSVIGYRDAWFTATQELPAESVPRQDPFAQCAAHSEGLLVVPDASADDRFRDSELVTGALGVRFYAGCTLRTPAGEALGTIAVYCNTARSLSPEQRGSLLLLAEQAVAGIELRSRLSEFVLLAATPVTPVTPALPSDAASAMALLDSAPVAIYHTDAAGTMSYCNPEYRRIFGLKPDQSTDTWAQRIHPDDRERMEQAWTEFCRQRIPSRFAYRTLTGEGAIRHFSEQVVAVNGVSGWIGTITDFTDLVAARDNLRRAETLYSNTFDQAPLGIVYADRAGKFLRFNQAFCAMLGFEAGDFSDKTARDLTNAEDAIRVARELERLWSGEIQFVDLEKRYRRKDGSVMWVRTTTSLVRENDATPEYSVEFLRDVTARKETEEELERVHKQLMTASRQAGMAEVATNVLHNVGNILNSINISASLVIERIKQSKAPGITRLAALLQEKGAAVGDFIVNDERGKRIPEYLVSLGEQLTGDQRMALEELASLRDNLEHIKDTVAMQQSYAKLCGVTETIAVVDLVEDSLRLNAGAFVRHGVTLQREFTEVPPITVDKHKVLQILVNLVRNAKYACDESGKPDKLITLRIEAAPAGVRISVIDNGIGIAAENMPRLFTHGFTTRASGHGFGLHSGALAAQELGGSLQVHSDGPGRGAKFTLELPCSPQAD